MGIYDRDYIRDDPSPLARFGRIGGWSVTTWLIVINVAVFVADALLQNMGQIRGLRVGGQLVLIEPLLTFYGLFSYMTVVNDLEIWRFITYQFLHANLWHLFFNMLALYFFGEVIESHLGRRRFLAFYLISGVAGGLMYLVLYWSAVLVYYPFTPLVGASAGIYGILIASAWLAPDSRVMFMIFPFFVPLKLRTFAMIMIAVAVFQVFIGGENAGGEAAHLGGGAIGLLLIQNAHWLAWAEGPSSLQRKVRSGAGAWQRRLDREQVLDEEVDRILDKIHREGQTSLTNREREILIEASRQHRRRGEI